MHSSSSKQNDEEMSRFMNNLTPALNFEIKKQLFKDFEFKIFSVQTLCYVEVVPDVLLKILKFSQPRIIGPYEVVVLQGDAGDFFYLILKGSCDVTINK